MFWARAKHRGSHKALRQRWRVWINTLGWAFSQDVFFSVQLKLAGRAIIAGDAVHQDQTVQPNDLMSQVQGGSAEVSKIDVLIKGVHRLEKPNHIRPHAVVSEQDVPNAANERSLHNIFATPIFRPDGSNA